MEDSPSKKRRKATFRDVGPSLSKEELVRRLKTAAQGLTGVDQGEETREFDGFSASLASSFIFHHKDKDVKSYAACCFADILRIYAPEPPYNEDQLKDILTLLVNQLKGLDIKEHGPSYKRNFYILESLALVKTFNVSLELDAQDIVLNLFKIFLNIVSEGHNARVTSFMLDIMCPLIQEGDTIPPELLSVILSYLINPKKAKKPVSYKLACDLIERCSTAIEPHIQVFFNNSLVLGNKVDKEVDDQLYDLMFELYNVNKSVLMSVLPQLEFKLKGNEEVERLEAVKLLGRMFSSEDSNFAERNKLLWNCYLGRFRDISPEVRIECVSMSKLFIVSSVEQIRMDVTDNLLDRFLDADEKVRSEVLHVVFEAAMANLDVIDERLIDAIKERMRDKKWNIRRESITCIGKIYKKIFASSTSKLLMQKISWVPSKALHQYILQQMEDRLCIERVVHGCLVPVTLDAELRMKRLFQMYTSFDPLAKSLFGSMLQHRAKISKDFSELLSAINDDEAEEKEKVIHRLTIMIARALPEPLKTQEHLKKLVVMCSDAALYKLFCDSVNLNNDCPKIIKSVAEIVKKVTSKNPIIETVKSLLDRTCPMLVDKSSFVCLLKQIRQYFNGFGNDEDDELAEHELVEKGKSALNLIQVLAKVRPAIFQTKQSYEVLLVFLKHNDKEIVEQTLRCLTAVISNLGDVDKSLFSCYKPVLNKLVVTGSCKQSKYALHCLNSMLKDATIPMDRLFNTLVENLDPEENYYTLQTTLAALGEMALLVPDVFERKHKQIVRDFVVKEVMVVDREETASSQEPEDEWGPDSNVSEETNMKVQAIKLLVKWLLGLDSQDKESAMPVLRLLCTLLNNDGDLSGDKKISAQDRSRLRLAAGCAILKLAQKVNYVDVIELEHYQQVALVIQDSCFEVRERFTTKLHKGLETLRLPPDYLAVLALVAVDPSKERRSRVKQMIQKNSQTRRNYSSQNSTVASRPYAVLPEYSLPYVVHLLAHHPDFDHKNNKSLLETKEYLWFFLEPIMGTKAENYSFLKKLLENIKRTRDKQNPDDETANEKIYAVCDLAIACIMHKTQTFTLKDFPGNVVLPKKLFIAEKNISNNKSYLPKGFVLSPKKQKPSTVDVKATQKITGKKATKSPRKRALSEDEGDDSDDDKPLRSPPKKSRNTSSEKLPRLSSSKKTYGTKTGSSNKKNNAAKKALDSPLVQKVKRNLNESPKKKNIPKSPSPKKNTLHGKNTRKSPVKKPVRSSPVKKPVRNAPKKSPVKKQSPKKKSTGKQMNGHKLDAENEVSVSDEEEESSSPDKFTAVLDEKPAKGSKRATPSPKKAAKNVRMAKTRVSNNDSSSNSPDKSSPRKPANESVNDEKPSSKLKIRRKVRSRR